MVNNSYIKKLKIMENEEHERQLSVGIPEEFTKQYSFEEGDYVVTSLTDEGILLKKIKHPEKVIVRFRHVTSQGKKIFDYSPVSLKDFNIPYDWDVPYPDKDKKRD